MGDFKNSPLSGILNKKTNLAEILLVAIVIALGTNIIVSSLVSFSFFDGKIFIWVGLLIIIFALIYLSFRMLGNREYNKKIKASIVYDVKNKQIIDINNYKYSKEISKYMSYAFNESKDIEAIWESDHLDNVGINQDKTKSMELIEEVTEYILLDTVSTHLNSYFSSEDISKNNTTVIDRNEISEVITKNKFLDLFSKPMNERSAFIKKGERTLGGKQKNVQLSAKDSFFNNFELQVPKDSKLIREEDGSISIKNKRFVLNFKVDFKGVNTSSIPSEYLEMFHKLTSDEYKQFQIDINTKIKFNLNTFISNKGWEYYNWVDSLINRIEDNLCPIKFKEEINWASNQLLLKYIQNEMANTRDNKETYIFYIKSDHPTYNNIWSELNSGTYANTFINTEMSKAAIEKLMNEKKKDNLDNLDVLGVYYKDENLKSVYKIKLENFTYDEKNVSFEFTNSEELSIKSKALSEATDTEHHYYNYNERRAQLIVCVDENIDKLISRV